MAFVVFFVAISPLTGATRDVFSIYGIRLYELLLILFLALSPVLFLFYRLHIPIAIGFIVILGIMAHSLAHEQSFYNTLNSLRDIVWYFLGVLLGNAISGYFNQKQVLKLYIVLVAAYSCYLLLGYTVMSEFLINFQDETLVGENDVMLRIGFYSLPAIMWLYAYLINSAVMEERWLLFVSVLTTTGVVTFFSFSRTMLIVYVFVAALVLGRRRYFVVALLSTAAIVGILWLGAGRFDIENIAASWLGRNLPFIDELADMSMLNIIQGKGIGETIYIPWFEAVGLNPEARNLDGLYQTLLIKVGILGGGAFVMWHAWIILELRKMPDTLHKTLMIIITVQLIIGLTTSYLFQPSAVFFGLPIGIALAVLGKRFIVMSGSVKNAGRTP